MNQSERTYQAVVWELDSNKPGVRTTVLAYDLEDAERKLKQKYGNDVVITLHSEEDADKPR